MVNSATAFQCIEELADLAIDRIFLAPHDALVAVGLFEIFLFCLRQRHVEMFGDTGGIAVMNFDHGIRAAIARAFQAVIFWFCGHGDSVSLQETSGGLLCSGLQVLGLESLKFSVGFHNFTHQPLPEGPRGC
jgi:hypothetical protein